VFTGVLNVSDVLATDCRLDTPFCTDIISLLTSLQIGIGAGVCGHMYELYGAGVCGRMYEGDGTRNQIQHRSQDVAGKHAIHPHALNANQLHKTLHLSKHCVAIHHHGNCYIFP
jgi:hypothetical protein